MKNIGMYTKDEQNTLTGADLKKLMNMMEAMANAPKEAMGKRTPGERGMYEIQRAIAAGKEWDAERLCYKSNV